MPKIREGLYETNRTKGNFLASEVGLRLETRDMTAVAASLGVNVVDAVTGATVKVIKAGYVYPSNAAAAEGIVFEDCYPNENGLYIGSLMTAGKVWENRLSVTAASAAKADLPFIEFKNHPEAVRPDFGSIELTKLTAPTIAFVSGVASWTGISHNDGYAFFVDGVKVAVAAKNATSIDLSGVCQSGDYVQAMTIGDYVDYKNSDLATPVAFA